MGDPLPQGRGGGSPFARDPRDASGVPPLPFCGRFGVDLPCPAIHRGTGRADRRHRARHACPPRRHTAEGPISNLSLSQSFGPTQTCRCRPRGMAPASRSAPRATCGCWRRPGDSLHPSHGAGHSRSRGARRVTEEEKYRLLREAWALICASHHEGWGMNILEAASVGTPSLAVAVPGVRDAVIDGVTGVLVPEQPEGLAAALARAWFDLASDSPARTAMGEAAQKRAEAMDWGTAIDRWASLVNDVAAGRRPRRGRSPGPHLSEHPRRGTCRKRRMTPLDTSQPFTRDLRRTIHLFKLFRQEHDDPQGFYSYLAADTASLVAQHASLAGQRILDVGGGPGYFSDAFRRAGARCCAVEPVLDTLSAGGMPTTGAIVGDGQRMPIAPGTFDICHSSNVIEHVPSPHAFLSEMLRVVRPGGIVFLAFTNWYSPFGGHDTAPWHYLGAEIGNAALRTQARTTSGESLWDRAVPAWTSARYSGGSERTIEPTSSMSFLVTIRSGLAPSRVCPVSGSSRPGTWPWYSCGDKRVRRSTGCHSDEDAALREVATSGLDRSPPGGGRGPGSPSS